MQTCSCRSHSTLVAKTLSLILSISASFSVKFAWISDVNVCENVSSQSLRKNSKLRTTRSESTGPPVFAASMHSGPFESPDCASPEGVADGCESPEGVADGSS